MIVVSYLLKLILCASLLRSKLFKMDGLELILVAFACLAFTGIVFVTTSILLLIQGSYMTILYVCISLTALDIFGHFYFGWQEKQDTNPY